jgi:catechol 2,3-dioxygenase-like lactoylglutathione lyase family enzyme
MKASDIAQREKLTLGSRDAMPTLGVKDLTKARGFYEGVVGLKPVGEEGSEAIIYSSGASQVLVYQSKFAGTNQATALTWVVGSEVDGIVQSLKEKGVKFEHYDMPDTSRQGDVHVSGDMRIAWFKDPDGNILAVVSR